MKIKEKFFISMTSFGILLNDTVYATTEVAKEDNNATTKYIFIGIAILVIALLLFLGYKMDTNEKGRSSISSKVKKNKKKLSEKVEKIKQNSGTYNPDENVKYEEDNNIFNNEDLNDETEYQDDEIMFNNEDLNNENKYNEEEDSLFSTTVNDDKNEENVFYNDIIKSNDEASSIIEENIEDENEFNDLYNNEEDNGKEFDTSIIDSLDEEDNIDSNSKKSFDETMLFNNSDFSFTGKSLEEEIDNLDNIDDLEKDEDVINFKNEEDDTDSFINELKKFEEPVSDFEGFSVASKKEENNIDINAENEKEVKPKKYTKVKKTPSVDDDFLSQMEANLEKSKEDRNLKKSSKTTRKTTKKKED